MGFYACNLPESVGGGGLDYTTLGLIERELGKASYGLSGHLARPTELLLACEGDQIDRYLMPCVSGENTNPLLSPNPVPDLTLCLWRPEQCLTATIILLMAVNTSLIRRARPTLPLFLQLLV